MLTHTVLPEIRRKALRQRLNEAPHIARILEAHNGLSAILASTITVDSPKGPRSYDGLWISGLTENLSRGLPDIELQGMSSRIGLVREIINVTDKPILVDGDTGGTPDQLVRNLRTMEILGISGLVIEDKVFPKNNSLDGTKSQILENPEKFADKVKRGKDALISPDFMLVARLEALIAGEPMDEAISRAEKYIAAGADAIVIHSNKKEPTEILTFAERYRGLSRQVPLIAIPTTYNTITEEELEAAGVRLVIYANHQLRSAYNAMRTTAELILKHHRSLEVDPLCMPLKEMFKIGKEI